MLSFKINKKTVGDIGIQGLKGDTGSIVVLKE
jgi:hypothetical protein